jgi:uncharacterized protein YbjT (DUF2867 family)
MSRTADRLKSLPKGVEGVVGDLAKPETLAPAFDGVDALYLATPVAPDETMQGLNAIEAAKAAKLKHVVVMSVQDADEATQIPHFVSKLPIEGAAKSSGMAWTILRPCHFFQNDWWIRDAILQAGVYPAPLSDVGLNRVDVRDIAEAGAIAITSGQGGRTITLVGPDTLTGAAVAATYSKLLGRPVHYVGGDLEAWAKMAGTMMPGWLVLDLKIMYEHLLKVGLVATPQEVAELTKFLGRAPRGFEAFAQELIAG